MTNNDFKFVKLIDLCIKKPEYGSGSKASDFNPESPRYVRITDIDKQGYLKNEDFVSPEIVEEKYFLEENDLLFARSGSVGKTYLYNKNDGLCQFAGYLIRFKLNQELILQKFMFYYTKSKYYWNWIETQKKTVTISNINAKQYSNLPVPVFPLDLQEKIVKKLKKLDELMYHNEVSMRLADDYLDSLFIKLFGSIINSKWDLKRLEKVATINMGQSPPGKSYNDYGEGMEFFQGKGEFGDISPIVKKWTTSPSKIANPNDILFSVRAPVGSVNIANIKCCIGRGLSAITPSNELNYIYLYYYFKLMENNIASKGTGSTIKTKKKKQLSSLLIPIPPLNIQNNFSDMFFKIQQIKSKQKKTQNYLEDLFNSILDINFKGGI